MKSGRGFSLVEMLSVLAVVGVLTTVAAAGVGKGLEKADAAKCAGQLRQWGMALQNYVQDNDGYLPRRGQGVQQVWLVDRPDDWFNCLMPYLEMPTYNELVLAEKPPKPGENSLFVCPCAKVTSPCAHFISYGMNMYLSRWDQPERTRITGLTSLSTLAFLADSPGGYASTIPSAARYSVMPRHGGRANVVFVDGHVSSFSGDYLGCGKEEMTRPDIRWKPGIEGDTWKPNN